MKAPTYTYKTCRLARLANLDNLEIISGAKQKLSDVAHCGFCCISATCSACPETKPP